MKSVLIAFLVSVAFLLGIGLWTHDKTARARQIRASAILDLCARNVYDFVIASNTLPTNPAEVAEFVVGPQGGFPEVRYNIISSKDKRFSLTRTMDSANTLEIRYQISTTGAVRLFLLHRKTR